MRLFIAEKPELAKAIVEGLGGKFARRDGYFESSKDIVTYCFGHLLGLCDPEDYDISYKKWNMAHLPIVMIPWRHKPITEKEKQLNIIVDLIKKSDEIVNAGDPDEEGQLLVDEILEFAKCTKPVKRLLINDNNIKVVQKSLVNMRNNKEFKGLSDAALARSVADQLYGYNLTRAYTLAAQKCGLQQLLSVGRVQTPILGLVVNRDRIHESHQKAVYYNLHGFFALNPTVKALLIPEKNSPLDEKGRINDENYVKAIETKIRGKIGKVIEAKTERKELEPPLPYNLLQLQADAHRKLRIKPDETLKITQDLRERHKVITYNRSDCQYLSDEQHADAPAVLTAISRNLPSHKSRIDAASPKLKSRAFNSKNVSAHHAIIPTETEADFTKLTEKEKGIYELIAMAYLVQFHPNQVYDSTFVAVACEGQRFEVRGKCVITPGFRAILKEENKDDEEEKKEDQVSEDLRSIKKGQQGPCQDVKISRQETKPLPQYTLATLMQDLARVSKYVKDPKIKELLLAKDKEKKGEHGGIGTPATRTAIIKTLLDRGFITEKGKAVISTELGRNFFDLLPASATCPDMTALWHKEQKEIANGEATVKGFLSGVTEHITAQINFVRTEGLNINDKASRCSDCEKGLLVKRKGPKGYFWGCSTYPECRNTCEDDDGRPNVTKVNKIKASSHKCALCGKALVQRKSSHGIFWGCSAYPNCKRTYQDLSGNPKFG